MSLFCQDDGVSMSSLGRFNIGFHGVGLSYELPVSDKIIWENSLGIGMSANVYDYPIYYIDIARPIPYLKTELKFFINRSKRFTEGKKIDRNSGNYIGIQSKYSTGSPYSTFLNQNLLTELHWGVQRSIGRRWIYNGHIGWGFIQDYTSGVGKGSPTLGVRFGFRF